MIRLFRSLLLLAALLLGWSRPGAAQVFEWARLARHTAATGLTSTTSATDAAGNTYVTAGFQGQLQVGSQTLPGPAVAFIKYAPTGQVLWAQSLTVLSVDQMAVDPANGGVVIAGQLPSPSVGQPNPYYYAKYSAGGTQQWLNTLPALQRVFQASNRFSYRPRLTVDGLGNTYLLGILSAAGTVGGVALDNRTTFVLQSNASGAAQWVRELHGDLASQQMVGPGGLLNPGLAPKPGGGCLLWGQIFNTLYLGPGTTTPLLTAANSGGVLLNLDAGGTLLWSRLVYTSNHFASVLNAAATDAAGNCYVTGGGRQPMNFGAVSTSRGFALAKYDANGTFQWLRGQQANTGLRSVEGTHLVVDAAGTGISVAVLDSFNLYRGALPPATRLGSLALPALHNIVRYDAQGEPQWVAAPTQISGRPATGFSSFGLGIDGGGNLYWAGTPWTYDYNFATPTVPPTISVAMGSQTTVGPGVIVSRLAAQANALLGEVYSDQNGNGQRDNGEPAFPGYFSAQVTQNGTEAFYPADSHGQFQAFAAPGAYTLTLAPGTLPRYHTVTQPAGGSYAGSFSGSNQVQANHLFGIGPVANQPDVRVSLTPYGVARVGVLLRYRVTVENVGTTTAAGSVTATLDSRAQYVGSTPGGTQSSGTVSWSYAGLTPQSSQTFDVQFSLPVNLAVGTVLTYTAAATLPGDLTPADNAVSQQQTVVGPYDPNDIQVNYSQLTPQQVAARQPLDYTIRFQNMGTDTAFAVVLQDTLDAERLQVGSLHLISQSHNCTWMLSRQGTLTVRLLNAKLPPRSTNVIGSQGYVQFRVRPRGTLLPGAVIPNRAHITFDYAAPVATNTVTTTVLRPTAQRAGRAALSWDAYPNPATDALTVSAPLPAGTVVTVELLDGLGRAVRRQQLTTAAGGLHHTLDLRGLAAGAYQLRLGTPAGPLGSRGVLRQ